MTKRLNNSDPLDIHLGFVDKDAEEDMSMNARLKRIRSEVDNTNLDPKIVTTEDWTA